MMFFCVVLRLICGLCDRSVSGHTATLPLTAELVCFCSFSPARYFSHVAQAVHEFAQTLVVKCDGAESPRPREAEAQHDTSICEGA